jgi:hypothetical protein
LRRSLTKTVAASAMAVAFVFTGWAATAASAAPPPQASAEGVVTVQGPKWVKWKVYSTYAKCRKAGIASVNIDVGGDILDWRCSWDSPGWMLENLVAS